LAAEGITVPHCFTTRYGGVSTGYLSSLNIGLHRGDDPKNVEKNFQILADALQIVPEDPLFKYFEDGEYVYYVHSFYAKDCLPSTLGTSQYGNVAVTGVVRNGNVYGTQFHPEKSGDAGLRLLKAFAEL
jgi:anthranilate/para-aminobenzoate synthase component II